MPIYIYHILNTRNETHARHRYNHPSVCIRCIHTQKRTHISHHEHVHMLTHARMHTHTHRRIKVWGEKEAKRRYICAQALVGGIVCNVYIHIYIYDVDDSDKIQLLYTCNMMQGVKRSQIRAHALVGGIVCNIYIYAWRESCTRATWCRKWRGAIFVRTHS